MRPGEYCEQHQRWHRCHECDRCGKTVVTDPPFQLFWLHKWCSDCYFAWKEGKA